MCTGIRLTADNKNVIYARTLEFGQNLESEIIVIPRNYALQGTTPSGKQDGMQWKTKYATVGANAAHVTCIVDGVNETGLAGGLFYFPNYAKYQEVTQTEYAYSLAPWELLTWLLTNFSTITEIKKALSTIKVNNALFGPWGIVPPVHAIIHDPAGNSIVIEYINGECILYENPLGVFTNAPTFDWHLTNLQNYINLSALNATPITLDTIKMQPLGQGSGMLGLPGDFTSPSRFIRATAFSQSIVNITTEQEACDAAFHLLNLFDITKGIVRSKENNTIHYEYTQWTSAADLHNKRYYFHTYDDRTVRMVNLTKMDLNATKPVIIAM